MSARLLLPRIPILWLDEPTDEDWAEGTVLEVVEPETPRERVKRWVNEWVDQEFGSGAGGRRLLVAVVGDWASRHVRPAPPEPSGCSQVRKYLLRPARVGRSFDGDAFPSVDDLGYRAREVACTVRGRHDRHEATTPDGRVLSWP